MRIVTKKKDVIWNYVGTAFSMASGFVLLPLLLFFLSEEEVGLWYVYVAISNFSMLFEFGFNPSFARNIVYVVSGAHSLAREGRSQDTARSDIDWHLLNTVIAASRLIYALIAFVVLIALVTVGTVYINYIAQGVDPLVVWPSWAAFCASIAINLYFLYSITVLRGYGDIAGENWAKTFSRLSQLIISAILLYLGLGLIGASIGYLCNGLFMRLLASHRIRSHRELQAGRRSDGTHVAFQEMLKVLGSVGHLAWRDGLVQLAAYASTQAMSLVASLTLGLSDTGSYSILLQFANAACTFSSAYPKSFFPSFQSAFAEDDEKRQLDIASQGIVAYWLLMFVSVAGISFVVFPVLPLFKEGFVADYPLFLALCLYLALWQQHSIFCNYIIAMNQVPYMPAYVFAAILGVTSSYVLSGPLGCGVWGIVSGQAASQVVYNNWYWPKYLASKLDTSYKALLAMGLHQWIQRASHRRRSA